ncbi:mRNA interferase HigB [termite gut metagenome]|uniref:mRNA interferase HigB n=1 Tax=termite gut metagenome TaxID=433724 RepID=A0A5J4QJ97_9ZZZZ
MRIITHKAITNFCINYTDAQIALEEWFIKTKNAEWTCFTDIKKTFNSVDNVGNQHYVFNIKGNSYRLVAIIHFQIKKVYIRFIGTHNEYEKIDCSKI